MKEKVVTVEKRHGGANGLRIKKTKQIMKRAQVTSRLHNKPHSSDPRLPVTAPCSFCI